MNLENNDRYVFRRATVADRDMLFEWANNVVTRENAFHTGKITYQEHCVWYEHMLADDSRIQLIMEVDNVPVGQIRIDIEDEIGLIDYSIEQKFRGLGYGTIMCNMMVEYVKNNLKIKKIKALVKTRNIASKRCFLKCGFHSVYEEFELDI